MSSVGTDWSKCRSCKDDVDPGEGWLKEFSPGRGEGLPTTELSAWLTSDSNIEGGAICDVSGRGVPARDWGDTDLFDAAPDDGLRWPGGGVPFSDLAS